MNVKDAKAFVRKMRISSNMILLVKKDTEIANHLTIENLGKAIETMKINNVLILVVEDLDGDVASLEKDVMNKHGWFRREDFAALMKTVRNAPPV